MQITATYICVSFDHDIMSAEIFTILRDIRNQAIAETPIQNLKFVLCIAGK
jgi:hypothetical protein